MYVGQSYYSSGFSTQPHNVTVTEGNEASFACSFNGSFSVPGWKINGRTYTWNTLPAKHEFTGSQLVVSDVDVSMNGSTYQCFIGAMYQSAVGTLTVLARTDMDSTNFQGLSSSLSPFIVQST